MAVSNSKKEANARWNSKNLSTLGCTIRKDEADAFRAICKRKGLTVNAVLHNFIEQYIEEHPEE